MDPVDPPAPAEPIPGSTARRLVAWLVIAVCIGLAVAETFAPRPEPAGGQPRISMEYTWQLRYVLGARELLPQAAMPIDQIEKGARNDHERLALAVVIADTGDVESARQRLGGLAGGEVGEVAAALDRIYAGEPEAVAPDVRERLRHQLGWFDRVVAVHGLPRDDPRRTAALAPAVRTAIAFGGGMLVALGGIVVGAVLLVLAVVLVQRGRLRPRWQVGGHLPADGFLEAFALYLFAFTALGFVAKLLNAAGVLPANAAYAGTWAFLPAFAGILAWLRPRVGTWADLRAAMGLHAGRGVVREAGAGVVGYLAGLPLIAALFLLTNWLATVEGLKPEHPLGPLLQRMDGFALLNLVLLAVVFAPVIEELAFRGLLMTHLGRRLAWWGAALATSLVFALLHPQGLAAVPTLAGVAIVLGAIRAWRGSLVGPVVAHACHNGALVTMMLLLR